MSEFDPEKPIKRIKPKKASDETVIEVGKPQVEPETMQPVAVKSVAQSVQRLDFSSDVIENQVKCADLVDQVKMQSEIEALSPAGAKALTKYCRTFNSRDLPKQIGAWYATLDATARAVYLYMRWNTLI